ncbi:MAG: TAXI family TRAP transporter solute-binding subunit [Synergistaceae bacterium]|nr:TAXI family TRAP transporter solute-binding subunit [Synergistaceae bacterium]
MKKLIVTILALSIALTAAGGIAAAAVNLSIGTASLGGNFFTMGAVIAETITNKTEYQATAQATGGSAVNVDLVHNGEVDMAICQASAVSVAVRGLEQFAGSPITDVRTLVNWNATPIHIMARRSIGAANITELVSSSIECITPGDGIEITTKMIFKAVGMSFDDAKIEHSGNRVQSASRFKTSGVDAIFDGTGIGAAWITDIIGDGSVFELLSLTDDQIEKIIAGAPEMTKMVIPAGTYKGQDKDVVTVGNWTSLISHEKMSEEVAYNITKSIIENKEDLVKGHNFFRDLLPQNIIDACDAPLHPGAEKYYKEIGILK